jgi:hypothetical protein
LLAALAQASDQHYYVHRLLIAGVQQQRHEHTVQPCARHDFNGHGRIVRTYTMCAAVSGQLLLSG